MAYRQTVFALGEWYHCYTRSIDRKTVFETSRDYERFLQALYVSNSVTPFQRSALYNPSHADFFTIDRGEPLVGIGAYWLMPNHFHLLLQEKSEGGISKFMQKIGTGFSMYVNAKHARVGNVFIKPFRSKHIVDDRYLRRVVQYIHLNPIELFEPKWKSGEAGQTWSLKQKLEEYRYGSLPDYYGAQRIEKRILDSDALQLLGDVPPLKEVLDEAAAYYAELSIL